MFGVGIVDEDCFLYNVVFWVIERRILVDSVLVVEVVVCCVEFNKLVIYGFLVWIWRLCEFD